jgi:hypothetical protein
MKRALLKSKSVNQSLRYLGKYTPRGNPIISSFPMAIYAKRMPNGFVINLLQVRSLEGKEFINFCGAAFSIHHLYQSLHP